MTSIGHTLVRFKRDSHVVDARTLIIKKRNGGEHSTDELEFMVKGFTAGWVPDYQMSAWLMAVLLRGMSEGETHYMTGHMLRSGRILDPRELPSPSADKHSTGGVGDKVSLALAPLVASAGVCVPMLSGRGLAHTGGTLDKLESVKGLRTDLTLAEFVAQVESVGCCIASQCEEMVPADGKIYALRDVTGTVESKPLIISSIVSKKVAEGAGCLVYDVKCGNGAFMAEIEDALELAAKLVSESERFGRRALAFVTDMNQPLGRAVGNSLEMIEAIELLGGRGPADLASLTLLLGGAMLYLSGAAGTIEEGSDLLRRSLDSGRALKKLEELVRAQGGDPAAVADTSTLSVAPHSVDVPARSAGYVTSINTRGLGDLVCEMGGGRLKAGDPIDRGVGALILKKEGDWVDLGEPLAELYTSEQSGAERLSRVASRLFETDDSPPDRRPLVHWIVTPEGATSWGRI